MRTEHLAFIPRDQSGEVVLRFGQEPTLEQIEQEYLRQVMARHGGNRQQTAAVLGVSERQVYRLIEKYRAPEVRMVCPCDEDDQSGWAALA